MDGSLKTLWRPTRPQTLKRGITNMLEPVEEVAPTRRPAPIRGITNMAESVEAAMRRPTPTRGITNMPESVEAVSMRRPTPKRDTTNMLESIEKEVLGPHNSSIILNYNEWYPILEEQGKFDEAIDIYQRVLREHEKAFGLEHPTTLDQMRMLGSILKEQGKLDKARDIYRRALRISERIFGLKDMITADTIRVLGSILKQQGKFDEAIDIYQKVFREYEKAFGLENSITVDAISILGSIFEKQGKLDKAIDIYQRALREYEIAFNLRGTKPMTTIDIVGILGSFLEEQGRLGKALEIALSTYEKVLGDEHSTTIDKIVTIASILKDQGELENSLEWYERALDSCKKVFGRHHPTTNEILTVMNTIVGKQQKLGVSVESRRILDGRLETPAVGIGPINSKPINQEQPQVNQKASNKSSEPSISGSGTGSNYTCMTGSSSSIGISSNTSAPHLLPPQNSERVENDIASALAGIAEVSTIIKEAFKGLSPTKFNRRLIRSLRGFSKNVKKSPSTKQLLSKQQLLVLRGIGRRVTLRNIALKIKESLECSDASAVDDTALRSSSINEAKKFTSEEIVGGYFQSSADIGFRGVFCEPIDIRKLLDHDDSDESLESSDDDEEYIPNVIGYESVQGILDFLKSDEILEIFKNAVIERFLLARRKDKHDIKGENAHKEGGTAEALENRESEYKQQILEHMDEGEDFTSPGASIHQRSKEIGVQSENISPLTMPLLDEKVQRSATADNPIKSGDAIEGKAVASTKPVIRAPNPALKNSSLRCLSPQLTEESGVSQDVSASPMPMANDEYLWATRFSDGKTHISFEIARRWDLSNEIKGWVEDFLREPINWWPLSPHRRSAPQGYVYVKWKCRCGKRIFSIIRKERMHQYHMYQWFRSHSGSSSSSTDRPPQPDAPAQPIANSASPNARNNETLMNPTPPSIAALPGATSSSMTGQGVRDKLLMWCINLGSKITVVRELRVSPGDNDEAIFRSLRAEYLRARKWRRWFSLYTISYIRFVKFRLYRLDLMRVSCYNKEEIPTPNHPYYEYRPETVDVPPVPTEELMEYFEDPSCIGTTSITLDVLPKKTNGKMSMQEKYGWGLRACEALSFFRILMLFLVVQAGPIAFFIYWLIKHPGDLQNASVPLFLAFALLGTFIVFPTITEVRFYDM